MGRERTQGAFLSENSVMAVFRRFLTGNPGLPSGLWLGVLSGSTLTCKVGTVATLQGLLV